MILAGMFARQQAAPGGGGGSFGTYDPANKDASVTLSESNMRATATSGSGFHAAYGTSGKAYDGTSSYSVEFEIMALDLFVGIGTTVSSTSPSDPSSGGNFGLFALYSSYGSTVRPGFEGGFASYTVGDRIGFKVAPVSGDWLVSMFKNGTLITTAVISNGRTLLPCFMTYFDNDSSARIHTDPADMTYFASYGAAAGWPA